MAGKTQAGYFQCNGCRDKFTCRTGTVMERSHIPIHKWLLAIHLLSASKKGMSAHQLHRMLGVTYKSAWPIVSVKPGSMRSPNRLAAKARACRPMRRTTATRRSARRATKKGHRHEQQIVARVEPGGKARAVHVKSATKAAVRDFTSRGYLIANS